jgi:hypothetical protein
MKKIMMLIFMIGVINNQLDATYSCIYQCNDDPLMQIYPNQNMCDLLATIPPELKNLDYVMYPNCDIYNTNRFGYNKRFNLFPVAIIVPQTYAQVQFVLQVLENYKLPFAVRSGGHCYGPGSLSSGYIIDLRNFNAIIPDTNTNTVSIGAGCHLGDVISALGAINYAIPTGTCPSVGITGLALGGGIGLLVREFGLTTDAIMSMTLLTADGIIIEVTQQDYPDLFWALRGAGANAFGIVLNFTFKMYFIPQVSFVELTWNWEPKKIAAIAQAWQKWFPAQPNSISSEIIFSYNNGQLNFKMHALKVGAEPFNEWQSTFEPFNPDDTQEYHGNYLGAADFFASTYTQPFSKVKTKFLFSPVSQFGINVIVNFFTQLPKHNFPFIFFLEYGGGGGVSVNGDSSYFPRNAYGWFFEFIYWPFEFQEECALRILRQFYARTARFTSPYSYANLIDYELGNCYLPAYYGTHINRLIQIKNTYDPNNIFTWRQGIPLTFTPKPICNCNFVPPSAVPCPPH